MFNNYNGDQTLFPIHHLWLKYLWEIWLLGAFAFIPTLKIPHKKRVGNPSLFAWEYFCIYTHTLECSLKVWV